MTPWDYLKLSRIWELVIGSRATSPPWCFSSFHTNGLAWWVTAVHGTIVPFLLFCQMQKHGRGERRETFCLVIQPVRRKGSPVVVVMKKISALTKDRT